MLFVAHNVLVDEPGLLLLQALRSYLELRTAIKFEVHTADTLAQYIAACEGTEQYANKDWNVPKFHSRLHVFDHIEKKERVEILEPRQLVKHDHRRTVATYIREQIEALNEDPSESPEDMESSVLSNIDIGSKLKPVSFAKLEQDMSHDAAFHRFRVKFGIFTTQFLAAHNYNLPNGQPVRFDGTDTFWWPTQTEPVIFVFDVLDGDTSLRLKIMYGHNFERRDKSALPTPEITVLTSKRRTNSSQDLAIESRVALLGTIISYWRASLSCEG
ncbi:hypothetical protein B0H13DRAFT_1886439 [Mycena leptocephala]|nr:hypothetical protein B0H13DRAFT_1886439 [Mycena leptocephala]